MVSILIITGICHRNRSEATQTIALILIGINAILALVLIIWLYGLVSSVWKGVPMDIYEFVALSVMLPLLRMC